MQLSTVTIMALYLFLPNAQGSLSPGPKLKVADGSVASQLKETASQSFLRTRGGNEGAPTKTAMGDEVQNVHEVEDAEELKEESSSVTVAGHDDMRETSNSSDLWAYEKEHDDGTVLTGSDPLQNNTLQSLEEESDDTEPSEPEEDEIPEEWTDPTNSTDEWAYEKANDDGTVLYGTNPLMAKGFVWEQDDLNDEEEPQEAKSDEQQAEDDEDAAQPKNQVVLHAGKNSEQDEQDDEWVTGEETDDGTVVYGTNPLEHQSDDDDDEEDEADMESKLDHEESDDYNADHAVALKTKSTVNSTHDDEEEYDDGTLDYGTNPMDTPDDDDDDDESYEGYDVVGSNSTQADNEPEEYDDGTVMYGTNPLEPSDEEESGEHDVAPSSNAKALPAPAPSHNISKEF